MYLDIFYSIQHYAILFFFIYYFIKKKLVITCEIDFITHE